MKIIYWSDYACPWCYIGAARMKKAIANVPEAAGSELELKAFQLDPSAPVKAEGDTIQRLAEKYGMTKEQAMDRIKDIVTLAEAEGLAFNYANAQSTNTMDAHRLTKLAMSKGDYELCQKITTALYDAYFRDNEELASKVVLQRVGVDCGLAPEEVEELLSGDAFREEVIADEREAAMYGIHAVPFFVVGRYGISGAQSTEYMEAVIRKALEEEIILPAEEGAACGPDGCPI